MEMTRYEIIDRLDSEAGWQAPALSENAIQLVVPDFFVWPRRRRIVGTGDAQVELRLHSKIEATEVPEELGRQEKHILILIAYSWSMEQNTGAETRTLNPQLSSKEQLIHASGPLVLEG